MKPSTPLPQCKETVVKYVGLARYKWRCKKKSVKDGFCTLHHPDYQAAKLARWDAESKAREEKNAHEERERKETQRRASAYPRLVEALREHAYYGTQRGTNAINLLRELGELK